MAFDIQDIEDYQNDEKSKKTLRTADVEDGGFEASLDELHSTPVAVEKPRERTKEPYSIFGKIGGTLALPGAAVRSALFGNRKETAEQIMSPEFYRAADVAPSGKDIAIKAGIPANWGNETYIEQDPSRGAIVKSVERNSLMPSPAGLAGFGIEVATDPLTYAGGLLGKLKSVKLPEYMAGKAEQAIGREIAPYIKASDVSEKGVVPEILSKRIYDQGMAGDIGNKDILRQKLGGLESVKTTPGLSADTHKLTKEGHGLIGEYADDLQSVIDQVSPEIPKFQVSQIHAKFNEEHANKISDITSAEKTTNIPKREKILADILEPDSGAEMSLSDLQRFRKNNAKKIDSKDFYSDDSALEAAVRTDLDRFLRREIKNALPEGKVVKTKAGDGDARAEFESLNNVQNHLLQIKEALHGPAQLEKYQEPSFLGNTAALIAGGATTGALGMALNSPAMGTIGTAMGVAGLARGAVSKGINPLMAKSYEMAARNPNLTKALATAASAVSPQILEKSSGRSPQSVEEVSLMKLPRNTEEAIQSPELLLEKVKMLSPQMLPVVKHTIEHEPQKLPDVMFALSQEVPHAFSDDKYGRFDGKIPAASMMKYISDVRDDKSMSNTEKAKLLDQVFVKKVGNYTPEV